MSTLTPNYGLIVPEATDALEQVRADYATNLGKIDNIGGGGGSGHTIIDKNGNSMPQETGLQFTGDVTVTDDSVNNKTVVNITGGGGGGAVYGCFIDTNNIITSGTYSQTFSYTATRDCYMSIQVVANTNDSATVTLDGENILGEWTSALHTSPFLIPMKQGQVLAVTSSHPATSNYTVYGVTQGTENIFTPIIYSDTERMVGIWRDNKPLYAKTLHPTVNVGSNTINHGIADLENCVRIYGVCKYNNTGEQLPLPYVSTSTPYLIALGNVSPTSYLIEVGSGFTSIQDCYVTLFYTKSTDVAGSGNWNTDGIPTVHYSTSEQVIGTWTNGKPLYQKTYEITSGVSFGGTYNYLNLDPDIRVRRYEGFVARTTGAIDGFLSYTSAGSASNYNYMGVLTNPLKIEYTVMSAFQTDFDYINFTIQYTKTTD